MTFILQWFVAMTCYKKDSSCTTRECVEQEYLINDNSCTETFVPCSWLAWMFCVFRVCFTIAIVNRAREVLNVLHMFFSVTIVVLLGNVLT